MKVLWVVNAKPLSLKKTIPTHAKKCESKHICHICEKNFVSDSKLQRHIPVHSRKDYFCEVCMRSFKNADVLNVHMCNKNLIDSLMNDEFKLDDEEVELIFPLLTFIIPEPGSSSSWDFTVTTPYDVEVSTPGPSGFSESSNNLSEVADYNHSNKVFSIDSHSFRDANTPDQSGFSESCTSLPEVADDNHYNEVRATKFRQKQQIKRSSIDCVCDKLPSDKKASLCVSLDEKAVQYLESFRNNAPKKQKTEVYEFLQKLLIEDSIDNKNELFRNVSTNVLNMRPIRLLQGMNSLHMKRKGSPNMLSDLVKTMIHNMWLENSIQTAD